MPQSNALVDDTGKSFFSQSSIVMHALTLPSQLRCFDSCRVDIVAADCAVYAIPFAVAITSSHQCISLPWPHLHSTLAKMNVRLGTSITAICCANTSTAPTPALLRRLASSSCSHSVLTGELWVKLSSSTCPCTFCVALACVLRANAWNVSVRGF